MTKQQLKNKRRMEREKWRYWNDPEYRARKLLSCKKYQEANREKHIEYLKRWRANHPNPNYHWENSLKKFGLTAAEYKALFDSQNGLCAICNQKANGQGKKSGRLAVDHDHDTGEIRGLLCGSCNTALGLFKDSPELLESAILYLRKLRVIRKVETK